ncbi:hypothetical protein E3T55_01130 [Cryobacterium frigoriphilum]|uniref:Uncharacterized protein n=1 Tax=Cryobacterium frigoriphilum TaxID=1259150 RepID=A0A4R9AAQ3_9MICO|nr:hypothetical protein [Cryobacterium frigoriphilum]TFD55440.1 hypothetical protein E3T55_01130 [Cryobacterium frigoriphilum]
MPKPRTARTNADAGFTLVELLIYMAFAVIVLTLVGGMLISTLTAEKRITARSEATTSGQLVSQSVHSGVRNSLKMELTSSHSGSYQFLVAETVTGAVTAGPECEAWYFTEDDDGAVYFKRDTAKIFDPAVSGDLQGWMLMAHGVAAGDSDGAVFTARVSSATPPTPASGVGLSINLPLGFGLGVTVSSGLGGTSIASGADTIDLALAVAAGQNSDPVQIESTTIRRVTSSEPKLCF